MPCYRCGARQTDPVRGASPWKRGVRRDRQVLICPECQQIHDWPTDLDRCRVCGSTYLVSRLGEIECRDCGEVRPAEPDSGLGSGSGELVTSGAPGLSEEVAQALARVLGRRAHRA